MESEFTDILTKIVLGFITVACFGLMLWLLKKWLTTMEENLKERVDQVKRKQMEMNGSVKTIIEKHHQCREELPGRFVGIATFVDRKEEVDEISRSLFDKIDEIKNILINGTRKKRKKGNV